MAIYIDEFLYRGKAPSTGQLEAWHVVLGNELDDGFGKKTIGFSGALTPAQSEAAGFPLPAILAAINTAVMDQLTQEQSKSSDLQTQVDTLTAQMTTDQQKLVDLTAQNVQLTQELAACQATGADLQSKLDV